MRRKHHVTVYIPMPCLELGQCLIPRSESEKSMTIYRRIKSNHDPDADCLGCFRYDGGEDCRVYKHRNLVKLNENGKCAMWVDKAKTRRGIGTVTGKIVNGLHIGRYQEATK